MRILSLVLVAGLTAAACRESGAPTVPASGGGRGLMMARESASNAQPATAAAAPEPGAAVGSVAGPAPSASAVPVPAARRIIRNGTLNLEVADLLVAVAAVRAETAAAGGYVTNETQGRDEYNIREGTITCRVPAEKLDATLAKLQALGRVHSIAIQAEDITEQYFNLEIRLRNQQQLEARLLKLLDQPGNKVAELVQVEREVARVRSEIDELEGRKRFWDSQVSLSTVTVELHEPRPAIVGEGGGILDTLKRACRSAGENVVGTLAWFIAAAGVVIPAWIVLWVLWRIWKEIRRRRLVPE